MAPLGMRDRDSSDGLTSAEVAKFTVAVALAAIFIDASIGHGLTWENDPYWTYWITKTFLIATIFGLGTAWFGIGVGRGALITVVHTVVLTVYYWTFSPIGLPSTPTWLDLEHTWVTGVPIHFGVIYTGYLLALWCWRRRGAVAGRAVESRAVALRAFVFGVAIVVVAGGVASVALAEFPGFTWFLVRLLITVTFLLVWWGLFGVDLASGIVGGVVLALVWATYAQFLGPIGLPDTPLRILNPAPPPATVRWLDYRELWLISLPIYVVVIVIAMGIASRPEPSAARRQLAAAAVVPVVLLTTGLTIAPQNRGVSAAFFATGNASIEGVGSGSGSVRISATDMGNRVSPLPPNDRLSIDATVNAGGHAYAVTVRRPMVEDPAGRESTWWGVGLDVDYREASGEDVRADLVAFGLGSVSVDGTRIAQGIPVEVVASHDEGEGLELEAGSSVTPLSSGAPPRLDVTWSTFSGEAPQGPSFTRYVGGGVVLLLLLGAGLFLNRRGIGLTRA